MENLIRLNLINNVCPGCNMFSKHIDLNLNSRHLCILNFNHLIMINIRLNLNLLTSFLMLANAALAVAPN